HPDRGACGVPRAAGIRRRACVLRGGREPGSRRGGRNARAAQERYHGGSRRDRPMLELTDNARRVRDARYLRRDAERRIIETPEQLFARVARAVAHAELVLGNAQQAARWEAEFHALLTRLEFLPNSPTLMNAGTPLGQLSACFVLPVEDSMEGIFETLKNAALIQRTGGGTGFAFSRLRPSGAVISGTGGVTPGPVSFMRIFDRTTENIKLGGKRRGANMGVLRVDHPDIREFVAAKLDGVTL